MNNVKFTRTVESIDRYRKGKEKLEKVLTLENQIEDSELDGSIRLAEVELEAAFADLLHSQPRDVSEVLAKSRLFIDEVVSDAELTTYQTQGLLSIVDALADLVSKTKS